MSLLCCHAAQLACVIDERLKEATEDANQEKALKDVVVATIKDKGKVATVAENRAQKTEKARVLAKQKLTKMDIKLGRTKLKLVEVESLNLAQVDEIADLKMALKAYEDKWYNMGFVDAEGSVEPNVYKAWKHWFEEGWMAALQAMGVPADFPLRNPEQIPFPKPPPPIQNPSNAEDEKDTSSMKKLVQENDSHVDSFDLEVTSNFDAALQTDPLPP